MTRTPYIPSIIEAAHKLRTKEYTVQQLWSMCSYVARATDDKDSSSAIGAYIELFSEDAKAITYAQEKIDKEIAGGEKASLLCGIPISIKDNILINGKIASAGSKMLENYVATYDATVIEKLKKAGALFLGRTNMDEFAMGGSTEHSSYGATKNPHDHTRVPGGSSGGAAASVAGEMALGALGSDTGGSIRQPAAYCGLVGLKPTYGRVSRYGAIAMGSSLDQIGPLTKTVADCKALYEVIQGVDPRDATTISPDTYEVKKITKKLRVGVPYHLLSKGIEEDVLSLFTETIEKIKGLGHEVVAIELPASAYALPVYYIIMPAEASTNLSRYDGVRYGFSKEGKTLLDDYVLSRTEGFGEEVKRRILLGTFVLSSGYIDAYYRKAHDTRDLLIKEYTKAFESCDVIAFPTTPTPAFRFGENADPVSMYVQDIFTVTANLTGMPALSVPMGTVVRKNQNIPNSLPVGIHFTAPHGAEELLFTTGALVTGEEVY
jgi:aspartyl-tRNA(Asn)/glutamyl-tRNA(Gln) amidotransferase subunit A